MEIVEELVELIKTFEKFSNTPYRSLEGLLKIGYGHKIKTNEIYEEISESKATDLLINDVKDAIHCVIQNISFPLNKNQLSSLVSFTYDIGSAGLQRSTLRQKLNYGEIDEIESQMLKWVFIRGQKSKLLVSRRMKEIELFYK